MAFRDFSFPEVQVTLGLTLREAALFAGVPPLDLSESFRERMEGDVPLALAINTEKARSEFIIAPVLSELRRHLRGRFALFSGVEFNVDPGRGLNGFCDFLFTRSPLQPVVTAPVIAVAEAKNDNLRSGLGQCIAATVAAREFNANAHTDMPTVYGVVTTGGAWKFLRLDGTVLTLDVREYFVAELPAIMGILAHILEGQTPPGG